ncbi:MAG: DEAD/DEAH box helicase family protein [Rhodoplanes sp.]|uniref:DEAD/DEAH box helicase n=1 Tax=Rhodoplanes sp. TaxID=1968906 RepID=UPI0018575FD8|nr:DEAD/DEAH box helicase family protein [Rhodoplanes sp.]NVO12399.1 DEAD/DEAH box helicase family protein [Rhodoplanes sp.]
MRYELKTFQTEAARSILNKLAQARPGVTEGELEAITLSAPTGSGKTITVAAVIDWLFGGADGIVARPQTTFLWLSDSPELNAQSKAKLMAACDNVPFHKLITVDSESFNELRLQPGHVYFINTQLLGRDKILTKQGDRKNVTFWQTIANTVAAAPQDFVVIIDEAHRGAGVAERQRKPIMQKFITGSDEDGLLPVPLVLGMSATPQRFTELLGNTSRTQRPVSIPPDAVQRSGLLKDLIVVTSPAAAAQSDLTLLENAAARWKDFRNRWAAYCTREREKELVSPVLVVQVVDGGDNILTRTPLDDVVRVIERQIGQLGPHEIVHCFQNREDIQYSGRIIRRMDASRIQGAADVKVVFFKTALTTGWDCPRAEVMMSFRRAQDPTSIAQLVGRMIRTPLARRIESDEVLNTVELFLPHYDSQTLEDVLARLRSPDEHDGTPSNVTTKAVEYPRNPAFEAVFSHLAMLKNYSIARAPKMSEIKRALRLAGLLVHDGLDEDADERLRSEFAEALKSLRDDYATSDPGWDRTVREGGEIDVDVTAVEIGAMNVTGHRTARMVLSAENIEQLFDEAGRVLAAGEGLHRTYWKRYHDRAKPNEAKLELFAILQKEQTDGTMKRLARMAFDTMWEANKQAINRLPASQRARYKHLIQTSGKAEAQDWELPDVIVEMPGSAVWTKHLFADGKGEFSATLNTWEAGFLAWAMRQEGFVCWLRNLPRRDWAFCVPYEHGGEKPFYPDFVIVRQIGASYLVDLLEPHDDSRLDTWAKTKGLAKFAEEHHLEFGRLMVGRKKDGTIQLVDVSNARTRAQALRMASPADLEALFSAA